MNNPKLSIIIPCWNCRKTIGRLLDSIVTNNMPEGFIQVIVCDDKSTDGFLDIVKTYEDKLNITYCTTTREFHCPGNTRQAALPYIKGEWFTFIDNDDLFEPDAFKKVFDVIKEHNIKYTLVTNFREYNLETGELIREITGSETDTWLHGKYFNTDNTLNHFHCHFKDDLFSHEDVYFNSNNLGYLIMNDYDYVYADIFTYKWIFNEASLSRSYFNKDYYYIEQYLGDYIVAASDAYFKFYKKDPAHADWYVNQIMMTLLHAYFYHQASIWRIGYKVLPQNIYDLHVLKARMIEELGLTEIDIINYIYRDPGRYNNIKIQCFSGCNEFIESQSFRDFVLSI